jgi:hypothetical protein
MSKHANLSDRVQNGPLRRNIIGGLFDTGLLDRLEPSCAFVDGKLVISDKGIRRKVDRIIELLAKSRNGFEEAELLDCARRLTKIKQSEPHRPFPDLDAAVVALVRTFLQ